MTTKSIAIGGLLRCCILSLQEYTGPEEEGQTLVCTYCRAPLILRGDRWHWDMDREKSQPTPTPTTPEAA